MDFKNIVLSMKFSDKYFITDILNISEDDLDNLAIAAKLWSFVNDLNNLEVEEVLPLTKYETYVVRTKSLLLSTNFSDDEVKNYPNGELYQDKLDQIGLLKERPRIYEKLRFYFDNYITTVKKNSNIISRHLGGMTSYNIQPDDIEFINKRLDSIVGPEYRQYITVSDFDSVDIKYLTAILGNNYDATQLKTKMDRAFRIACYKVSGANGFESSDAILDAQQKLEKIKLVKEVGLNEIVADILLKYGYNSRNIGDITLQILDDLEIENSFEIQSRINEYIASKSKKLYYSGKYVFDPKIVKTRRQIYSYNDEDTLNNFITSIFYFRRQREIMQKFGLAHEDGTAPDVRFIKREELPEYLSWLIDENKDENNCAYDCRRDILLANFDDSFFINDIEEEHILVDECNYDMIAEAFKKGLNSLSSKNYRKLSYDMFQIGSADVIKDVIEKRKKPSLKFIEKMCEYLNIPCQDLIKKSNYNNKYYITAMRNPKTGRKALYIPEGINKEDNKYVDLAIRKSAIINPKNEEELREELKAPYAEMLEWIDLGTYPDQLYFQNKYNLIYQYYFTLIDILRNKGLLDGLGKEKTVKARAYKAGIKAVENAIVEDYLDKDIYINTEIHAKLCVQYKVSSSVIIRILKKYKKRVNEIKDLYRELDLPIQVSGKVPAIKKAALEIYVELKQGRVPNYKDIKLKADITEEEFDTLMKKFDKIADEALEMRREMNNMDRKNTKCVRVFNEIVKSGKKYTRQEIVEKFDVSLNTAIKVLDMVKEYEESAVKAPKKEIRRKVIKVEELKPIKEETKTDVSPEKKITKTQDTINKVIEKNEPITLIDIQKTYGVSNFTAYKVGIAVKGIRPDLIVDGRKDNAKNFTKGASKIEETKSGDSKDLNKNVALSETVIDSLEEVVKTVETPETVKPVEVITPSYMDLKTEYNNATLEVAKKKNAIKELVEKRKIAYSYYYATLDQIEKISEKIAFNEYIKETAINEQLRREDDKNTELTELIQTLPTEELVDEVFTSSVDNEELKQHLQINIDLLNSYAETIKVIDDALCKLLNDKTVNEVIAEEIMASFTRKNNK